MTHEKEIILWSKEKDGTGVWKLFEVPNKKWMLLSQGMFLEPESLYIVDNEWASLRKAQIDSLSLECKSEEGAWGVRLLSDTLMKDTSPASWRVQEEGLKESTYA